MSRMNDLADNFKKLHESEFLFVMPCAWDAFSAKLFEQAGFSCVGTTSGGVNWVRGRKDYIYSTPKKEMLDAYGEITNATHLPVSGDLENGYGENPSDVADTIQKAISLGMVGGSIEDQKIVPTNNELSNGILFDRHAAVERIKAARIASDETGINFTLTARCEVFYTDSENPYAEAVERLNVYYEAGADCLFVPGLNEISQLTQLVKDVQGPISFGMGASPTPMTLSMLEDTGVRRVSTGGGMTRAVFSMIQEAALSITGTGTFDYLNRAMSENTVNELLSAASEKNYE